MTYELALELKDAGFPQIQGRGDWIDEQDIKYSSVPITGYQPPVIYCPTLEELIEACGEKFVLLTKNSPFGDGKWTATGELEISIGQSGSTPTEAVAALWLALNPSKIP